MACSCGVHGGDEECRGQCVGLSLGKGETFFPVRVSPEAGEAIQEALALGWGSLHFELVVKHEGGIVFGWLGAPTGAVVFPPLGGCEVRSYLDADFPEPLRRERERLEARRERRAGS